MNVEKEWYKEYKRLGGKSSKELFEANRKVFEAITVDAYTANGILGSRAFCYKKWVQFIEDRTEAGRYFDALRRVTEAVCCYTKAERLLSPIGFIRNKC